MTGAAPATVRILHASDLHVGDLHVEGDPVKPLVDAALSEEVDAMVLVGDIFDHNRVPTEDGQALVDELARLVVPVVVPELAASHPRVLVAARGFVSDCLETLEELGVRLRAAFLEAGGRELALAPCLNDSAGAMRDALRDG